MAKEKKKGGCLSKVIGFIVVIAVLSAIGSSIGGKNKEDNNSNTVSDQGQAQVQTPKESTSIDESEPAAETQVEESEDVKTINSFVGQPLQGLIDKFAELGYTGSYFADGVDFTSFIGDMAADYSVEGIDIDEEAKTATVNLVLTSDLQAQAKVEALKEKLSPSSCWVAAENYGEEMYPYGFELHYFMGKIAEEPYDDNTWFLKAECTITNEYNTEYESVCEIKVTGTTDSPQIAEFIVY